MADKAGSTPANDSGNGALTSTSVAVYCDRCGEPADVGDHGACAAGRELEPPRYCAQCRRRMVVQVVPRGWTARCSEHGTVGDIGGA